MSEKPGPKSEILAESETQKEASQPPSSNGLEKNLIDAIEGFIGTEAAGETESIPGSLELADGSYYKMLMLSRGKAYFKMEAYHEAIEAFQQAEELGSYQGKFLLGLTMIEAPGYDYFAGLDHMIHAANHMMVSEYLHLLKHALETGERLSLIIPEGPNGDKHPADLREIAITLDLIKDMESSDAQRNQLLYKLLKLLQRYRLN